MTRPLTDAQFRALVERFVQEQGDSEKQAARLIGVSHMELSNYLAGQRWAGRQLAAYFGFAPQVVYVKQENKE